MLCLELLFGFRPVTLARMQVSSLIVGETELTFSEGFRKAYFTKKTKLRRLAFPWLTWPCLKELV
jgi:hypothetical protein